MATGRVACSATATLLLLLAGAAVAGEPVRIPVADAVLDRNGDGFQDVIVSGRTVQRDLDFDGRFDISLSLAFKEYTTEGHQRYLASGLARDVFVELTREGLDRLCASERVAADWTAAHFREFLYYGEGYGRLVLLADAPENDGRLASARPQPKFSHVVEFNPDGTVETVRRGDRAVALATFDYGRNVSAGTILRLPPIATIDDVRAVRATLDALF
jgi:hypothetical protein